MVNFQRLPVQNCTPQGFTDIETPEKKNMGKKEDDPFLYRMIFFRGPTVKQLTGGAAALKKGED